MECFRTDLFVYIKDPNETNKIDYKIFIFSAKSVMRVSYVNIITINP